MQDYRYIYRLRFALRAFWIPICLVATSSLTLTPVLGQRGEGPARIVAGNVIKTKRASLQSFVGTLEAIRKTTVGSAVEGRVTKVHFDAGDPVGAENNRSESGDDSATGEGSVNDSGSGSGEGSSGVAANEFVGQPLIEIRTETLDIEIRAAEIQKELAEQALAELKLTLPQSLDLAKANQSGAESQLDYAKANYRRSRSLQEQSGAISALELEEARSLYLAAQQAVVGARAEVRRLTSTSDLQLAQSRSRVSAAIQESLRLKDLRDQYTIRAPFNGVVTKKLTEVGQWVTRGTPIVELVQLDPIEMVVNIPQEYSGQLQESLQQAAEKKQPLEVQVKVTGIDQTFIGELVRIIPQADLRSRSFPVRIRAANPAAGDSFVLKPGMLGRASLLVGRETEMILVPKDALVLGPRENKVYKIAKQGDKTIAVPITVQTGAEVGSWVQVVGSITEQDQVIVIGNERLRAGAEVIVTKLREAELDE